VDYRTIVLILSREKRKIFRKRDQELGNGIFG